VRTVKIVGEPPSTQNLRVIHRKIDMVYTGGSKKSFKKLQIKVIVEMIIWKI